jgi:hypothetical protein
MIFSRRSTELWSRVQQTGTSFLDHDLNTQLNIENRRTLNTLLYSLYLAATNQQQLLHYLASLPLIFFIFI